MRFLKFKKLSDKDELGFFAPKTWEFWRSVIVAFCVGCILGHWLELPYCMFMDHFFGIVSADYAVWNDPWYHPYWVYGIGAVFMTLVIEPVKEWIIVHSKSTWRAIFKTFLVAVFVAMVLELVIGLIINQPDEYGIYPYWDNSQLPLNVFGQAWLVNDIVIGFVAMVYVWLIWPAICEVLMAIRPKAADGTAGALVGVFAAFCIASYAPYWAQALGLQ